MNTKHISLALAAFATLLAGCAKSPIEEVKPSEQLTDLELSYVGATETKAAIDGKSFPEDGEIGLFLFGDEMATEAYGTGYENVKYSYNSTKGKWTASPSIKVGSETGYLYGYYPYSATATDVKAIPVASSLNGDDVMYAAQQTVTDATASHTTILMNHALARVTVTVKNNGYTGAAQLSKIMFGGAETSVAGTLDATSGALSSTTKADVELEVPETDQEITSEGSVYECLLVPSAVIADKQDVTVTFTIDGDDKTATLSGENGVIIAQGTKSNITIGLSNSGISVSSVSIDEWKEVEVGGNKVTVKRSSEDGIADDVFIDVTSNGSTVTIKTLSATGRFTQCTCTPAGKATCTPSIDATTGICTFTITDVQDDITAEVSYLKCNVTVEYDSDMGVVKLNGVAVASGSPVQFFGGEEVKFLAEAKSGCGFVKWIDSSDEDLSIDNPYTISSVTSNITLNAVFGYEISAEVKPAGAGTVTGAGIYAKGFTATLTATAGGSFAEFVGWVNKAAPGDTTKTSSIDINVAVAASYVAVFRLNDALSGVFTVAADDQGNPTKKVYFSQGNLVATIDDSGVPTAWKFAANQYDYLGVGGANTTIGSGAGDVDLFCWSTSTNDTGTTDNYGICTSDSIEDFLGDFFDWGNAIGDGNTWRTLTTAEWKYLCDTRVVNGGTGEGKSYQRATINSDATGVYGLILYPDDYTETAKTSYTCAEWTVMESAGAVFLPAAGFRLGSVISSVGKYGEYWSSSVYGDTMAYMMNFNSDSAESDFFNYRLAGCSVRLVIDEK